MHLTKATSLAGGLLDKVLQTRTLEEFATSSTRFLELERRKMEGVHTHMKLKILKVILCSKVVLAVHQE